MSKKADKLDVITVDQNEKQLRVPSKPVDLSRIGTKEFESFIKELYDAMMRAPLKPGWVAVGISAIQVGIPDALFIAYDHDQDHYEVYINPKVKPIGEATDVQIESCLSIPELEGPVLRHKKVKVEYTDMGGVKQSRRLSGWNARIAQHEYDHINGILFTDKLLKI